MDEQQNFISGLRLSTDYSFAYNILSQIIPYLGYGDLVSCSEVCTVWNSVIREDPFWFNYVMGCCGHHLKRIQDQKDFFFRKIELHHVVRSHEEDCENVLSAVVNLEELVLVKCCFNFSKKFAPVLENLKVLKIVQSFWRQDFENPDISIIFNNLANLSALSISTSFTLSLDALESLKQLKHLFIDVNYSKGFFSSDLKFLDNLESFGVGFTNHKEKSKIINRYHRQFCDILKNMRNMKKLLLHGLDVDFSILETVCKLEHLESLELGLLGAWNHYSSFLIMCHNIKKLSVKLILPRGRYLNVEEIAAHNSILLGTIKELKDSVQEFTWIFDQHYMRESEQVLALQNDKWERNLTALWDNIGDFKPQHFTQTELVNMAHELEVAGLDLKKLEEKLSKELPSTKVRVVRENPKNCYFCPGPAEGDVDLLIGSIRVYVTNENKSHDAVLV